jgi:L-lactate utilization protein LutB
LYEAYEKKMMSGNIAAFANDLENWVKETLESKITMVTEQGDVEDWNRTDSKFNDKILKELNNYLKLLRQHT